MFLKKFPPNWSRMISHQGRSRKFLMEMATQVVAASNVLAEEVLVGCGLGLVVDHNHLGDDPGVALD